MYRYVRVNKVRVTLFISGSKISHFLKRLKASNSVSPNNNIGSHLSRNLDITSFLGKRTCSDLFLEEPKPKFN